MNHFAKSTISAKQLLRRRAVLFQVKAPIANLSAMSLPLQVLRSKNELSVCRFYCSTASTDTPAKATAHSFIPKKAPVLLTEATRKFFKSLLKTKEADTNVIGIMLNYHQSSSGEPRMVFSFDFVRADQLDKNDESVSLEILDDGTPKPPVDSWDDGLPKLYVHHNAFMKVLGGKLDVDLTTVKLTLYDREGNIMDPNNT